MPLSNLPEGTLTTASVDLFGLPTDIPTFTIHTHVDEYTRDNEGDDRKYFQQRKYVLLRKVLVMNVEVRS